MYKISFYSLFVLTLLFSVSVRADLQVDINRGSVEPIPIAVPDFSGQHSYSTQLGRDIAQVIKDNLARSGLFEIVSARQFPLSSARGTPERPIFAEWKTSRSDALVMGAVTRDETGKTRVEFRLWDVFAEKQIAGLAYTTTPQNWRRIAHIISDTIYKRMTGEKGYFDSRIVYIAESGPGDKRVKRLAIMEQDGANHRYLTSGQDLVLTPRFSPNSQTITYMAYKNNVPRVYLYDLDTGRQRVLGDFNGMTFSPRFSPDGRSVVMSFSKAGNTDIYRMPLNGNRPQQLTNHPAIDTSPSYSPDGRYIAFESDRSGTQQIYVMRSDGADVKRITFGDGRYANPVWSPRGDSIAFTKLRGGLFYIGVIKPNGTGERLITQAYHVEGPTWSPNGRVLSYFKETSQGRNKGNKARLYTIDLTGYNEQILKTPEGASDPAWSPLNQ